MPTTAEVADAADSSQVDHEQSTEFAVALGRFDRSRVMSDVRRLSEVSNARSAALIALQWATIVAAGWLAISLDNWWAYLLAGLVIGTRQQALGILVHDAAHWLLFTNRRANDYLSDILLAFPVGLSTTLYRDTHFRHHRFTATEQDPDWVMQQADPDWHWPKTRAEAWGLLLRCLLGINLPQTARAAATWSPAAKLFTPLSRAYPLDHRLLFAGLSIVVYAVFGTGLYYRPHIFLPIVLLWIVPAMTLFNFLGRIRATAEHVMTECTHELNSTRTVEPRWWERFVIAPLGINYHLEHHLFPSVPGWQLAALHRRLMVDEEYLAHAHITRGYAHPGHGVLGELLTPRPQAPHPPGDTSTIS